MKNLSKNEMSMVAGGSNFFSNNPCYVIVDCYYPRGEVSATRTSSTLCPALSAAISNGKAADAKTDANGFIVLEAKADTFGVVAVTFGKDICANA